MESKQKIEKCNTNPIRKIIRIILSLLVIIYGIIYNNPLGILGLLTLYTAISGNCGLSIKINRSKHTINPNITSNIKTWEPNKDSEE